jgi:hypothetical protein
LYHIFCPNCAFWGSKFHQQIIGLQSGRLVHLAANKVPYILQVPTSRVA